MYALDRETLVAPCRQKLRTPAAKEEERRDRALVLEKAASLVTAAGQRLARCGSSEAAGRLFAYAGRGTTALRPVWLQLHSHQPQDTPLGKSRSDSRRWRLISLHKFPPSLILAERSIFLHYSAHQPAG